MKNILLDLEKYLQATLGQRVKIVPWKKDRELPFFLVDSYHFCEMKILANTCLLMIAKKGIEITPALIRKHWEQVIKKWEGPCIFVQEAISAYNRKRLIEHHVPFIIPGNQLYLPELGIDLREHFHHLHSSKTVVSPATQALLIFYLLYKTKEILSPSYLAQELGYTQMTMTRAFDELEDAGIGEVYRKGRERFWHFQDSKRELWEQVKLMLRSPVKMRTWVKHKKPKIIAGLSALAQITMLNSPPLPVYAIGLEKWKAWKESGIEEYPFPEDAAYELEIWYYDPELFTNEGIVDPFSLYLSLETNKDERVQIALEELKGKIPW